MMGLSPDVFWNLTLVEWHAALADFTERHAGAPPPAGLARADLASLMKRFPD